MRANICCTCFGSIFIDNNVPSYIKTTESGHGDCEVCGGKDIAYFYARADEIELAKKYRKDN